MASVADDHGRVQEALIADDPPQICRISAPGIMQAADVRPCPQIVAAVAPLPF